jgi:hypothetical protein
MRYISRIGFYLLKRAEDGNSCNLQIASRRTSFSNSSIEAVSFGYGGQTSSTVSIPADLSCSLGDSQQDITRAKLLLLMNDWAIKHGELQYIWHWNGGGEYLFKKSAFRSVRAA